MGDADLFASLPRLRAPGLFVAGTDTEVGKTVAACLIADQLRRVALSRGRGERVGVLKPFASGCRLERERLVSSDAEELAHAADFDPEVGDLEVVCPVRFRPPLAPAVALERSGGELDVAALSRALRRQDEVCSWIVVEGIGGVLTPLARTRRGLVTALDCMGALDYPVVVVARAGLGTLNHTALTCQAIRQRGLRVAGVVVNGYEPDSPDPSVESNRRWLAVVAQAPVLAVLPQVERWDVRAPSPALLAAMDAARFADLCAAPRARRGR